MRKGWWFSSSFSRNPWLSKEKKARKWRPNPLPSSILHKTLLSVHHQGPHLGMEKLTSIQKCTKFSSFEDKRVVILRMVLNLWNFLTILYLLELSVSLLIMFSLFESFWTLLNHIEPFLNHLFESLKIEKLSMKIQRSWWMVLLWNWQRGMVWEGGRRPSCCCPLSILYVYTLQWIWWLLMMQPRSRIHSVIPAKIPLASLRIQNDSIWH